MRRAVDGRIKVIFFATTLPLLKVVTVTFGATVFLTAVALAGVEVLRVLRFFGVVAFGVAGVFDLTVINSLGCVYPLSLPNKKPLLRGLLRTETKKSSL